jgi:hypothetical protein
MVFFAYASVQAFYKFYVPEITRSHQMYNLQHLRPGRVPGTGASNPDSWRCYKIVSTFERKMSLVILTSASGKEVDIFYFVQLDLCCYIVHQHVMR